LARDRGLEVRGVMGYEGHVMLLPDRDARAAGTAEAMRLLPIAHAHAGADCGLKALGMDHGDPTIAGATVLFCSDEHVTFVPGAPVQVGERIPVWPPHVATSPAASAWSKRGRWICAAGSAPDRYWLQTKSAGQAASWVQAVPPAAPSGHQSSMQQFSRRTSKP